LYFFKSLTVLDGALHYLNIWYRLQFLGNATICLYIIMTEEPLSDFPVIPISWGRYICVIPCYVILLAVVLVALDNMAEMVM
jgi:hypothetical protein